MLASWYPFTFIVGTMVIADFSELRVHYRGVTGEYNYFHLSMLL